MLDTDTDTDVKENKKDKKNIFDIFTMWKKNNKTNIKKNEENFITKIFWNWNNAQKIQSFKDKILWNKEKKWENKKITIILWISLLVIIMWVFWKQVYKKYEEIWWKQVKVLSTTQTIKTKTTKRTNDTTTATATATTTTNWNDWNNLLKKFFDENWIIIKNNNGDIIVKADSKYDRKKIILMAKEFNKEQNDILNIIIANKIYTIDLKEQKIKRISELNWLNYKILEKIKNKKNWIKEKLDIVNKEMISWIWNLEILKQQYLWYKNTLYNIKKEIKNLQNNIIKVTVKTNIPLKSFISK